MGNVIAEYADYALAYQLIGDSFRESLGEGQRYTDDRIRLIEKEGQITPRALSEKDGVSTAAISQWLKPLIEKGVLSWCDEKGHGFMGVADLEKAKRSGRAYLTVSGGKRLPTVFELTGDPGGTEVEICIQHMICIWMVTKVIRYFIRMRKRSSGQDIIFDVKTRPRMINQLLRC